MAVEFVYCPCCGAKLRRKRIDGRNRRMCKDCGYVHWRNAKPCASMILEYDKKVLLVRRETEPFKGYWVLPGGYLEYDETPEAAARREVLEEIGQSVAADTLVGVYLIDDDPRSNSLDVVYAARLQSADIGLTEHDRAKFFDPRKLPTQIAYKHRDAISDWRHL